MSRVEAGAQGQHKISRGYLPSLTYSSHYLRDPQFRDAVREAMQVSNSVNFFRGTDIATSMGFLQRGPDHRVRSGFFTVQLNAV